MSGRRFSPWPAYVDLFSGLVVLMFAVIVIDVVGRIKQSPTQKLAEDVLVNISSKMGKDVQKCSIQDICVNVSLNFDTGKDVVHEEDFGKIRRITAVLLTTLREEESKNPKLKKLLRIVVEGHTDSRLPRNVTDQRELFTYNWNLSAKRASSVMYLLDQNGLGRSQDYNVVSLGLASSEPSIVETKPCLARRDLLCPPLDFACRKGEDEKGPDPCDDSNRRTTIRIIFDYKAADSAQPTPADTTGMR